MLKYINDSLRHHSVYELTYLLSVLFGCHVAIPSLPKYMLTELLWSRFLQIHQLVFLYIEAGVDLSCAFLHLLRV
jgi:hypothetical protein